MLRAPTAALALAAWTTAAAAQAPAATDCRRAGTAPAIGMYSLFFDSGRARCVAPAPDADSTNVPCLRIGRIHVGQARAEVEALLGAPVRELPSRTAKHHTVVYYVMRDSVSRKAAYYVVEFEPVQEVPVAKTVQFTGERPPQRIDFSCLELGDSAALLRRQLGPPDTIETFNDEDHGLKGDIWYYDDVGVSIEVMRGVIYSVRTWRPDNVPARRRRMSVTAR